MLNFSSSQRQACAIKRKGTRIGRPAKGGRKGVPTHLFKRAGDYCKTRTPCVNTPCINRKKAKGEKTRKDTASATGNSPPPMLQPAARRAYGACVLQCIVQSSPSC